MTRDAAIYPNGYKVHHHKLWFKCKTISWFEKENARRMDLCFGGKVEEGQIQDEPVI